MAGSDEPFFNRWMRLKREAGQASPSSTDRARRTASAKDISIWPESPDQPEIAEFLAASNAYAASLYPAESNHLVDLDVLMAENTQFLVARDAGKAVGCAALVIAGDGSAELKRMWVSPAARGLGMGRKLLEALEASARSRAVGVLRLETGIRQPEAIGLYKAHGFVECPPFGSYQPDPLSIFMEKRLSA